MKIETFDRDDHQKLITAETDMETLEQFKHQAARKISAEAKIAGFRPGKAPYEVVRRMYGDDAIRQEAINLMLDHIYPEVVREAGIDPYGPGQLQDLSQAEPPKFTFLIPLMPEVELGEYKTIRSAYTPPVVSDEQVDNVIRRLQRRTAISTPVEKPAAEGAMLDVTVEGHLKEEVEGEDNVLVPETKRQMIAGDSRDFTDDQGHEWPFPGFSEKLIGLSAGDERDFDYVFPDDGSADDLSGKEAVFSVKVERVYDLELHPLDDEFAQSLGAFESYEKLRQNIQQDLQSDGLNSYNSEYIDQVVDQMVEGAQVKYPPSALDHEIEHVIEHFEERLQRDRLDLETYLKTRDLTREQFVEQEARQAAEKSLKRSLVLEKFSMLENIQITQEESQMILQMAQSRAQSDPQMKALAKGGMTKKQVAESLARSTLNEIFNQRMLNRLRDIATGKADLPSETDFIADASADSEPVVAEVAEVPAEPVETAAEPPAAEADAASEETSPSAE